ncbi:transcription initiation factor IIF, beta subunit-domain-containing protein [Glomus cerebriforme]|uniref:Transcription initiation factor IIF subunit beta n=1 Tax=Glomus cerebriforme TaxID=658196 RepID=A0A397TF13_9GLOM|nr:transcription initiation factor IIF, beta subunit-domain-containing protein [Glomus cerebriforme]
MDYEVAPVDEMNMEIDEEGFEYEDTDDIDLKDLENEAWLIKLPAYLFDKWADVADDNTELAKVQFFVDSRGIGSQPPKKSYKFILSDIERHENEPKEYDLEVVDENVADTYLFYQNKDEEGVSMAATATQNFIVKPTFGVDYSRKVRQRTLQAAQPKRGIKIIGDNENRGAYVPPGASAAAIAKFGNLVQKKPKVSIDQKTTRMPKNELIDLLFGAFEKYTYWTLRGLKDYAKQPESYLKDVLNEIAILDKRGPYNNCYHLKPEYSQQSSAASESIAPLGLEAPAAGVGGNEGIEDDDYEFENDDEIEPKLGSDEDLFGED